MQKSVLIIIDHLFSRPYLLTDVHQYPPETLEKMELGWLGATMMAFLVSRDREKSERYFELIWQYLYEKTELNLDLRYEFFVFLIKTSGVKPDKIQEMITQLPPSLRRKDLTTFEQMVAQAGEKWLAEHGADFVERAEMDRVVEEKEKITAENQKILEEKEKLKRTAIEIGMKANLSIEALVEMTSLKREEILKIMKQIQEGKRPKDSAMK